MSMPLARDQRFAFYRQDAPERPGSSREHGELEKQRSCQVWWTEKTERVDVPRKLQMGRKSQALQCLVKVAWILYFKLSDKGVLLV